MDHNLDDSLNLESTMAVDFEHEEDSVVSQEDITLDHSGYEEGISMEFEQIEEQHMLMDTGNEEIIDFMGDQITLEQYAVDDNQMTGVPTTLDSNQHNVLISQPDIMLDLQMEPQTITVPTSAGLSLEDMQNHKIFTIKSTPQDVRLVPTKKESPVMAKSTAPRQVPIAPKPPKLTQLTKIVTKPVLTPTKQYAIAPKPAPKPVALVTNKTSLNFVKKMTLGSVAQPNMKGNTVLAQIGKQLVMMPAGSGQKLKLVTAGPGGQMRLIGTGDSDKVQAQVITAQNVVASQASKPLTKFIVQGKKKIDLSNQPAVITKIVPVPASSAGNSQTRYVTMHQKTVPISLANNKVLFTSPTKQAIKLGKKQQIITINSPGTKLVSSSTAQGVKKIVLNTSQIKSIASSRNTTEVATNNSSLPTQLHQINVPGKGIQYIRLVTNQSATPKTVPKPQASSPSKTLVLTDNKGNLIQMSADKLGIGGGGGQPPPLVVSSDVINKLTSKPQQKLVRIAPITSKAALTALHKTRAGQSLLAPISPVTERSISQQDMATVCLTTRQSDAVQQEEPVREEIVHIQNIKQEAREEDSKAALRALIAETVGDESAHDAMQDDVVYDKSAASLVEDSTEPNSSSEGTRLEDQLIVVPSYMKQDMEKDDNLYSTDNSYSQEDTQRNSMVSVEIDPYQSPQGLSESDLVPTEFGLRPRKPCNCTKSQCLKLYCDCFANGEFCNQCNCNNCHNNLANEDLRHKAIRGCLDRNPNAFRPKIGKTKAGGPEIVRRHNKGCNCKRSGCLKNYCECYEAKIACTAICKCVGCRNVEETLERGRRRRDVTLDNDDLAKDAMLRMTHPQSKQPCSFMTTEVIEAVCQCLLAAAVESDEEGVDRSRDLDPLGDVLDEFARCLQDIISASRQTAPLDEVLTV